MDMGVDKSGRNHKAAAVYVCLCNEQRLQLASLSYRRDLVTRNGDRTVFDDVTVLIHCHDGRASYQRVHGCWLFRDTA